jgi:hypothetical protein
MRPSRKHSSQPQTVQLRKRWVTVDPREWRKRDAMTINVGLGTGSKAEQLVGMQMIVALQEKVIPLGLVTPAGAYETCKEITKLNGHLDSDRFFAQPNPQTAQQPIPPPQDPKHAQAQQQAQAAQQKAQQDAARLQQDAAHQEMRMKMEMSLEQKRFELDKQLKLLDAELKAREHNQTLALNAAKAAAQTKTVKHADGSTSEVAAPDYAPVMSMLAEHLHKANAPKRARKLADGSWISEHIS